MNHTDVKTDPLFKQLCNRKQLSDSTIRIYKYILGEYCEFTGKTLTELRQEAYNEQITIIDKLSRNINNHLNDYYDHLQKQDIMNSTIQKRLRTVRAFYNEYDIELPKPPKIKRDKIIKKGEDIIKIEDIRTAIQSTPNFKYKAIISLLFTSGMRSSDLRNLTVQDFIEATQDYHNENNIQSVIKELKGQQVIPCWNFNSQKTDVETVTFNTPECTEYLLIYLKQRKELESEDYLFVSRITNDKYSRHGIQKMFRTLNRRLSMGHLGNGYSFFRAHKLRAFFGSVLTNNDVPYSLYKKMMGQSLNMVDQAYIHPSFEACKRAYERCIDDLSTTKVEVKHYTSKEMQEIVERLNIKEKSEKELRTYIQNLQKDVEKLKKS